MDITATPFLYFTATAYKSAKKINIHIFTTASLHHCKALLTNEIYQYLTRRHDIK